MAKAKEIQAETSNLLRDLNSKYGKGSVILGSQTDEELEVIDSGSITLNKALQIGGIPIGKLIEIYGPESSGKSTITLHIMANFQKAGKKVALVDAEYSFDRNYAKALGVDLDKIYILQPDSQEDAYNKIIMLIESGEISLTVIDSHTALMPLKVIESAVGEATIGLQARINSISLGKIHPLLKKHKCTILAVSQLRTNIGGYGDPNVPTGGQAYKFYSDIRMKVSKLLEKADSINRTSVEINKNKCGIPFGKATFAIEWGKGIDRLGEVIDLSIANGSIKKGGAWFEVTNSAVLAANSGEMYESEGIVKLQGESKVKQYLIDNPEVLLQLEAKL